uniref:Uncharacterized protein n=1 Tax=Ciona savignyi TaxID=51511 RepID=H2Y7R2_CIOSA
IMHLTAYLLGNYPFWFVVQSCLVILALYLFMHYGMVLRRLHNNAKHLDEVAGVDKRTKHWFYGHFKHYTNDETGVQRVIGRTKYFPLMVSHWIGPVMSALHVYHPDSVHAVLTSGAPKDDLGYRFLRSWIGDGLLTSKGSKWFRNRRLLTPAFHYKVLKPYSEIFNKNSLIMVDKFKRLCGQSIDVYTPVGLMTLDIMLQCAMSTKTNCQHETDHPYLLAVKEVGELVIERTRQPLHFFDWIYNLSADGKRNKSVVKFLHDHTETVCFLAKAVNDDENDSEMGGFQTIKGKALDFLDILLQSKDEDGKGLTDIEIRDEVDTFLFEGHDTTSSGIAWALYHLAKYPEFQTKCREELTEVLGDRKYVEWNDLPKLEYLTKFIKESMRLKPPVYAIGRELEEPLKIKEKVSGHESIIPTGTNLVTNIIALHNHVKLWQNPKVFDPERFTKENIAKRPAFAYVPFSAGSRNCIGQNFAMNEMKICLAQVIRNLRLCIDGDSPVPKMHPMLVLQSKSGIFIKFKKI